MKFLNFIFNKFIFVTVSILAQLTFFVLLVVGLMDYWIFWVVSAVVSTTTFLRVNMRDINPAQQLLWVTVMLLLPVVGILLYVMIGDAKWTKRERAFIDEVASKQVPSKKLDGELPEKYQGQVNYLINRTGTDYYFGCSTEYFSSGEKYFASLKRDLEVAEKFIFLEFFIIEQGEMWDAILEILERKVKQGVEVSVMYDDIGSMWKLPTSYDKKLRKRGIKTVKFNKYKPMVTNLHNNRDHRKIAVIDGKIAYTGGINLADEYINEKGLNFYWKDTGIKIVGTAVNEFTEMFLQLSELAQGSKKTRYEDYANLAVTDFGEGGAVVPFGTGPSFFYKAPVAEETLLNVIAGASKELLITTPYLIVDYSINRALASAVARGVEVKIVIPDIPDKKAIYLITKNNAQYLQGNGVKIYRKKGSFVHAKNVVADGEVALVGTINFDYRSLIHHFENAVWMCGTKAVEQARTDVLSICTEENLFKEELKSGFWGRLISAVLKIFTPLF